MKGFGAAAASAAVIILSGAGGAYAADLNTKAPVLKAAPADATCTSIVDFFTTACLVQAYGVRFYGTIDIGYGYQSNGAAFNKNLPSGLTYFPGKMNSGAKWLVSPNALSQSNVGFQIKEPLGAGWSFVGQVEAAFDPASFVLANGGKSLRDQFGTALFQESGAADSSLNGTFYNSLGFVGVSNDTYGTLTFLRQRDLIIDALNGSYDPMGGSYAFSAIGGSGQFNGGGSTETIRATTSVKYRLNIANWRIGLFGQFGDYDQQNSSKGAIQGQIGADFNVGPGVFSVDAIGAYAKDAVVESISYTNGTLSTGAGNPLATPSAVTATISDNTAAVVGAKYTWDKLKLYAGYEWIQFAPPSDITTSFTDIAGYSMTGLPGSFTAINNTLYNNKDKVVQLAWVGARYSITDSLDIAGAYYHIDQNNFAQSATIAAGCAASSLSNSQCHGTQDLASALIDWKFAPKWDTYFGVMYTKLNGGLDNGFLAKDFWVTAGGIRFRW